MSEVNLSALAESVVENVEAKAPTPMQEINSALKECGFGWFHCRLLCASYFGFCAGILITSTVPYILPNAECDLNMDLLHKGVLSAIPYVGMICSSAVAGFLTDTFGRKKFLVGGYALMAVFNVVSGLSQNYNVLLASKFCEGLVYSYEWYVNIWKDKNIKTIDEAPENGKTSISQQLSAGLQSVKPMFQKPYVHYLMLFCFIYFLVMMLYNIIRMWFPQLSTIVEHYSSPERQELCTMLDAYTHDQRQRNITTVLEICVPTKSGTETYIYSMIIGCVCLLPYMLSGLLVNKVGKKVLLTGAGVISIGVTLGLRWVSSKAWVVALFASDMAIAQLMMSLMQATTVEFFPTTIRTLAISVTMTMGRTGSLVGNVMFPILLNMGCVVPFFTLTGLMICVTAMILMLPKKKTV
ncbi:uncharacterized protein LOC126374589 [Pectinophora gossypiella]|uniref:uncharacterized protein LOC126374589 n=1 Tax=Pectinophora gossypiella TaxID=13191 RepID=UPI00214E40A9|nr:uncharacterized protein LOC126374589 [Pectinophora gossypiella]